MIDTAIVLVAGMGTRLDPLTRNLPKCLVKVNGTAILENTLTLLAGKGIKQVIMPVGYMDEAVRARIGNRFMDMDIHYVKNPIFNKTNNMYSLWLARDLSKDVGGFILIEGDLFFDADVLDRLIEAPTPCCWAADEFIRFKDGCMLTANPDGGIRKIEIIRHPLPMYDDSQHKSAGMLKLCKSTATTLWDCLEFEVRHWHLNLYYDQVMARHLKEFDLDICDIKGSRWMEIDDIHDLKQAQSLFQ